MTQERAFKGIWIPAEIWLTPDLSISEKLLLMEVDSFCSHAQGKGCYANNTHFAKLLQVSENRVSHIIKGLVNKGLLERKFTYKEGTKEIDKRFLVATIPPCYSQQPPLVTNNKVNNTYKDDEERKNTESDNNGVDGADRTFGEVMTLFQDNICLITNPVMADDLADFYDTYGYEWCVEAIKVAARNRATSIEYVRTVLINWEKKGVSKPWNVSKKNTKETSQTDNRPDIPYVSDLMARDKEMYP